MGFVPHVSNFLSYGVLKCQLERDMCHLPNWATCPLPVFLHMAKDRTVWRLGTLVGKDVTGCIGSKNPEGVKVGVHIDC
jgi:hypothetical protein